ncbi:putative ATP synthase, F0 complex, subunit C, F/V-ATP synthase subunit C superfamily [Helianthus annuus]|uniref:ATP synthase, F0 complex, subunit C, F/V-ATP synthase subunit C superfamily n=1 Tax=Helianthus annuus TaxID=4232 RepID=A0A9K3HTQ2_HELAN|nr:putative ATP synthase, F0 complex, subunit C, F/V-ATP synthase subunit C superfamily [Helianthus annuus]KAJ0877055.1 putative ATP synthase, F0 complex, subunit C, F/V-ATP synthase subunit C superfamily [Helianthus annuus]
MKTFKDVMEGLKVIGAGTATIALAGAAVGIGKIFSFALTEAIALFALMMAFLILFVFWLVFSVPLRGYKIEKNALDGCPGFEKEGRF